jgi:hypothetical protein
MRATTPPLPFFSGNSLTRTGAVLQFSQDSTWPHLCSCLPVALSTHLRETRAYHPISEAEGQYPSSNQNSSPSFFFFRRDSTWPHFRACHWSFQHTYEDKRLISHLEWQITDLQGRKIIPLSSSSGFHMATLSCTPLEISTHLRGQKGSSPTLSAEHRPPG